jgi:hypothetical protein
MTLSHYYHWNVHATFGNNAPEFLNRDVETEPMWHSHNATE